MLVSAVSANLFQSNKINDSAISKQKFNSQDSVNEKVINSTVVSTASSVSAERLSLYESIREWKDFCHKQILNGKIDVIV